MDQNLWTGLMQAQMQQPQMPPQQSYQGLMGPQTAPIPQIDPYSNPSLWPVPPGMQQLRTVPTWKRDLMDVPAVTQGYDRNAVQGDDVMRQYFMPRGLGQEDI